MAPGFLGMARESREESAPPRHRHLTWRVAAIIGVGVLLLTTTAVLARTTFRPSEQHRIDVGTSLERAFLLTGPGMRPAEVRALLGDPSRRTVSLAEGYAWPEPKDVCWYYRSDDLPREFQICFISGRLASRGSYPIPTGGP